MNRPHVIHFLHRHSEALAAAFGLLCVIVGAVLSIELHPYYR
jgi:hypothetical protein